MGINISVDFWSSLLLNSDYLRCYFSSLFFGMRIEKLLYVALWPSNKTWLIMTEFLWVIPRCFDDKIVSPSFTISCVTATTWKFIRCEQRYLRILYLNLNKLDRWVFDWNAILLEQKGSWFLYSYLIYF